MKRLAILLSGRGSNFQAIADNAASRSVEADIAVVISNRPEARGLTVARERGIHSVALASRSMDREAYDRALVDELRKYGERTAKSLAGEEIAWVAS